MGLLCLSGPYSCIYIHDFSETLGAKSTHLHTYELLGRMFLLSTKGCVLRRHRSRISATITTHHSLTWSQFNKHFWLVFEYCHSNRVYAAGLWWPSASHISQCSILHCRTCHINAAGALWSWVGFGPKTGQFAVFAAWLIAALAQSCMLTG